MADRNPRAHTVPATAPEPTRWADETHGTVTFRTLVSAEQTPTTGLVHGIAELEPGDRENAHCHEIPETFYVLSGSGTAILDGEQHEIGEGDTIFIPPGCVHEVYSAHGMRTFYSFPADRFEDIAYYFVKSSRE